MLLIAWDPWISCLILRTPTLDFVRTSRPMTVESVSFGASPLDAELKCALPCSWACRAAGRAAPCVAAAHTPTRLTSTRDHLTRSIHSVSLETPWYRVVVLL